MARRGIGFIYVTVALDALAIGIVIPVFPTLIGSIAAFNAAQVATAVGVLATLFALIQFFAAPVIGALSDRFGRRPIVLASNLGLGLDFAVMALAPNLAWLVVGRLLSGIASGSAPAAYAYLADVTEPSRRAANFGIMFGVQALGATLGPAIGGFLSATDLRAPFWVAAALCLLNAIYGLLVLPESLSPDRRARFNWAQANPIGALTWLIRTYPKLTGMIAVALLLSLASQGANSITVVYASYRYGWTPQTIGVVLTVFGLASLAVQAGLVSPSTRRLGERTTFLGGMALTTLGLVIFGAAGTGIQFWFGVPLLALGAICGPVMGGYFSRAVADNEQGRLQGAWSGLNAGMGLIAPGLFTVTFASSISAAEHQLPGLAFFLAAALIALAVGIGARAMKSSSD
ncbi:MAG: MFS transporter [Alphaproteobacteria bacterium]|nr:MFS transporter [Alphaproteobacteria bacterium]